MSAQLIHGTAIAINGAGILLIGRSASGKSDLALRLIDRGALLVSDDAVMLDTDNAQPWVYTAPNIEGRIEVRGVGICSMDYSRSAPLRMIIELSENPERLPYPDERRTLGKFSLPRFQIAPFETSAVIKVEYALRLVVDEERLPIVIDEASRFESQTV